MPREHIKTIIDPKRKAVAPYNFVELLHKVVPAEPLPDQNCYHDHSEHQIDGKTIKIKRHTGRIKCTLTTESPLYTRCGMSPEDYAELRDKKSSELTDEERKKLANFFLNPDDKNVIIPGSSIRGMLRTLVEIASFSKIERVSDKKLFYRSLGDKALRRIYTKNFIENLGKVEHPPHPRANCYKANIHTGFLRCGNNTYWIEECEYGRISRKYLPKQLYQPNKLSSLPNWKYQHQLVYVQINSEQDHFFKANSRHRDPL